MAEKPSLEKMTEVYLKIRERRSELAAEFKKEDDKLKDQMEVIKTHLLQHCKEHDVDSVRTSAGLFYRSVRSRYWTSDWGAMHDFVLKNGLVDFFEKRLNQGAIKEYLEENPENPPPGLNVNSEYVITVKKK